MRKIRTFGYAVQRALTSLKRRPIIAILTVSVMTISMLLVGMAHIVEGNLKSLSEGWGNGVQMIVYLEEGTSQDRALRLSEALKSLPAVEHSTYVPPEKALEHLESSLGKHDELLDGIEASFLPASIEVQLVKGVRDLVSAHSVVERLKATHSVEDVEFLGNWVDDFSALILRVQKAGLWIVMLAGLIGIFTVIATMRLSADSRAAELRVLKLMGAPSLLCQGPNLIEGSLLGFLGAIFAVLLLWLGFQSAAPLIAAALSSSLGSIELHFLSARDFGQLLLYGLSLGAIGGLVTNYAQAK